MLNSSIKKKNSKFYTKYIIIAKNSKVSNVSTNFDLNAERISRMISMNLTMVNNWRAIKNALYFTKRHRTLVIIIKNIKYISSFNKKESNIYKLIFSLNVNLWSFPNLF